MNVRPISKDDAPAVASLVREDEEALVGRTSHVTAEDVSDWWSWTDLENDSWLFAEDERILAAGWFNVWEGIGHAPGVVARNAKGRGLGTGLLERAEERTRAQGCDRLRTFIIPEDSAAVALVERRGFRLVRHFWEMAIELAEPPPQAVVSEGLVLESFRESDARAFHAAMIESFAENWEAMSTPFETWWERRQGQDSDEHGPLWFVVRNGDELAGVIRNEANRHGGGFVGLLGVRKPWRGRGIGRALLLHTFNEFWNRGLRRVTLGVDAENPTGATRLYESVGMAVESTSATYEKTLA